jgi:eukaryotic-like serine/threonine-protein kinase
MGVGNRILTLFRLFLLFTVLLAVGLLSAITTIRFTIHGHQEIMPNLVGRSLDSAGRISSSLGLEIKTEGKVFNTQYPANSIVSQVPAAGTRVKMGQHVHVLVSLGQPQVKVPDIVGASARAAQITAIQDGLTVGDLAAIYWPDSRVDEVVAQEPSPSTAEVHSPALNVLVSLGPVPAVYKCPDFVGRPLNEARRLIQLHGFKLGSATPVPRPGIPLGKIVAQTPEAGSKISSEAIFTFQVAGPPTQIPPPAQSPPPNQSENPPRPPAPP